MIALLLATLVAGQAGPTAQIHEQAAVIADVLSVASTKNSACQRPGAVCIVGIPNVIGIDVRKVLFGKIAKGRIAFLSPAPLRPTIGRHALLMEFDGGSWRALWVSSAERPCFEDELVSAQLAHDPRFRHVGGDYCLTVPR